jgi:hypothetical protein
MHECARSGDLCGLQVVDRLSCRKAIEYVRTEVNSVGPDDRPGFGFHLDLPEEIDIR